MEKQTMRSAMAVFLLGMASAAPASEYTLMIYERADQLALRTDASAKGQAYWTAFAGIGQDMAKAGVLRGGAPLDRAGPAAGRNALTLSGYLVIDVADVESARLWASKIPAAKTGRIDVYPHAASKTGM